MVDEFEYVENRELDISEIELESDRSQTDKIRRVVLQTNEGRITYKPRRMVEEKRKAQGFTVKGEVQEMLNINEIPNIFWDVNEALKKMGLCKVRISYTLWNKEVDGQVQSYRFMRDGDLDKLEIISIEEKVK